MEESLKRISVWKTHHPHVMVTRLALIGPRADFARYEMSLLISTSLSLHELLYFGSQFLHCINLPHMTYRHNSLTRSVHFHRQLTMCPAKELGDGAL